MGETASNVTEILMVGGGIGGTKLLHVLFENPDMKVVGMVDVNLDARGCQLAKENAIPVYDSLGKALAKHNPDVIINATGKESIKEKIERLKAPNAELIGGIGAKIIWQLVDERAKRENETKLWLEEYETLYRLGLQLSSRENLQDLYNSIVASANQITETPAGSLTLFDEAKGEMAMVTARGFSESFNTVSRWPLRPGGLTSEILNNEGPLVVDDIVHSDRFTNPVLIEEGVRSLIAAPMKAEGKLVGILYVDDFEIREFTDREVSALSLLSTLTAMAIERAHLHESTKMLAITDELTGLFNHRHFMNRLSEEINRASHSGHSLALMMLDIDFFKHYNDTHGHLAGNEVLRGVSEVLREHSRDMDIVARYGGEEFGIVLPESNIEGALTCAERVREAVEERAFRGEDKQPNKKITVSIGIAMLPDNADDRMFLIDCADQGLYRAKADGRNRVVMFTEEMQQVLDNEIPNDVPLIGA